MIRKFRYHTAITLLAIGASLQGCSSGSPLLEEPDNALMILGASLSRGGENATVGENFPSNTPDVFRLSAYKGVSNGAEEPTVIFSNPYFSDKQINTDEDGSLTSPGGLYYPADHSNLYFYAYGPGANATPNLSPSTGTPTVEWTIDGNQDIIWSKDDSGKGYHGDPDNLQHPSFLFEHKLMRFTFSLVQGEGFADDIHVSSIKIKKCKTHANLDLTTGVLEFTEGATDFVETTGSWVILPPEKAEEYGEVPNLWLCCEPAESIALEVVAAGVTYNANVSLENSAAGVSHRITLTFKGTQIMASASLAPWEDVGTYTATDNIN